MHPPWFPEFLVSESLARTLIEAQFPKLCPVCIELLGAGWDNTAYLVNAAYVFRFPRRQVAVQAIENEVRVLPALAARPPLPVPNPIFVGKPGEQYPWPFAGYQILPGRTACAVELDEADRLATAESLAKFFAALHSIDADEATNMGARPDTLARLDVAARGPRVRQQIDQIHQLGIVSDAKPLIKVLETSAASRPAQVDALVHGDFYARHLLVDAERRPNGVIDWGDIHIGDRAIDLSIVCGFLPPAGRTKFESFYGKIDDGTWGLARFKALHTALCLAIYAHEVKDAILLREAIIGLRYVAAHT